MQNKESMKKLPDLLLCPFCGGKAKVHYDYHNFALVQCSKCGIGTLHKGDEKDVITEWNTRKPVDAVLDEFKNESDAYKDLVKLHSAAGNCHMAHIYAEKARAMADAIEIIKENLT